MPVQLRNVQLLNEEKYVNETVKTRVSCFHIWLHWCSILCNVVLAENIYYLRVGLLGFLFFFFTSHYIGMCDWCTGKRNLSSSPSFFCGRVGKCCGVRGTEKRVADPDPDPQIFYTLFLYPQMTAEGRV